MLPAPINKLLAEREQGILSCVALEREIMNIRAGQLSLNPRRKAERPHDFAITCMQVDKPEDRYLLCGYANGGIAIIDIEDYASRNARIFKTVVRIEPGTHKFGITGIAWYPIDTGMFISSSFDKTVKVYRYCTLSLQFMHVIFDGKSVIVCCMQVWDTNIAKHQFTFDLPERVWSAPILLNPIVS
jgi:WD40 repeat protein